MKGRVLVTDLGGRFYAGEVGDLMINDYPEKYSFLVRLPGEYPLPEFVGGGTTPRFYYFLRDEIEVLPEPKETL